MFPGKKSLTSDIDIHITGYEIGSTNRKLRFDDNENSLLRQSYGKKSNSSQDDESKNQFIDLEPLWYTLEEDFVIAMTGASFSYMLKEIQKPGHDPQLDQIFEKMLQNTQIFARMRPEDKALLVQKIQEKKSIVGMCGDGANDCFALKTADVGISLSEAEASIAAPFTSKVTDISCVVKILR